MDKCLCGEVMDPGDVNYDGNGFQPNGYFCLYNSTTNNCLTNEVIFDGTGLKPFQAKVALNGTCSGGTFLYFDGTAMKSNSVGSLVCKASV